MATCDICGNNFPAAALEQVPAKRITALSKQGFVPTQLPPVMKDMVKTDVTLTSLWQATVSVNTTDWGICPTCAAEVQRISTTTSESSESTGVTEQNAQLHQAVKWFIRSACVQLGGGDANTAFAFLNLAALAEPFQQLDSARQWLLETADEIDPRHIRFNSVGLDERYQLAMNQVTPSDIEAIRRLWEFYR